MKTTINMLSGAAKVKGQGVLSAYEEQVRLVKDLDDVYEVTENKVKLADITHYHTINFRFFLGLPFVKMKSATVGYVHFLPETVEQSLDLPKPIRKAFYWYMMKFYRSMDQLVTVNPYFIERLASYGVDPSRVTYIPNFVSSEQFHPLSPKKVDAVKEQYGIAKDKFVVFCAGQLQIRKGVMDFIKVAKRMPDVEFVWAGGFSFGQITDGYKEIKDITEHPPENVKFLGIVDRSDMNGLYNAADVMFLPSFEELFPMTILEAMCCHKPILLRDIDLYPNILFDYYCKGSNVEDFVSEIRRLQNDESYRQSAVEASKRGNTFYSREHVQSMWREYYANVLLKVKADKRAKRTLSYEKKKV